MLKQRMHGFARFLLFSLLVGFVVALVMVLMTSKVRAERITTLKDGTLVVHAEIMRVRDVPREIMDPEVAFALYSGQKKWATVTNQGKTTQHFNFPWIKKRTIFTQNVVSYSNGKWSVGSPLFRPIERKLYFFSFFVWFMSVACVVIIVMWAKSINRTMKKLTEVVDKCI